MAEGDDRRIRHLIESATQAAASGRAQEAERLLRQAEAEAPRHPLVLNEIARRMLLAGNSAGAYDVLEQAIKGAPSDPSLWLNLAAALRGLKRGDEEMAALEQALAIEPRNMRALLQVASLQEIQGKTRAAAATYRKTLQLIPPGVEPPPTMRPVLQHAKEVVEANDRELEAFLEERLKDLRARYADEPLGRFDRCLSTLLRKRRIYRQQPTFMFFPYLPTVEFYERSDFPWLDSIEAAADDIRAELVNVLAEEPAATLEPYVTLPESAPLDRGGNSIIRGGGRSIICGARASPIRSTLRAARELSRRSRRGRAATCRVPRRRPCSPFSMPRRGSRRIRASATRASSSICR